MSTPDSELQGGSRKKKGLHSTLATLLDMWLPAPSQGTTDLEAWGGRGGGYLFVVNLSLFMFFFLLLYPYLVPPPLF